MPSLLRSIFDRHVVPTMLTLFADDRVLLAYRIGSQEVVGLTGIVRSSTQFSERDDHGDEIKRQRCTIVILTGDVPDPQLKATWTITQPDGTSTTWSTDPHEGRGIETQSPSTTLIHLVRSLAVSRSHPNYRIQ